MSSSATTLQREFGIAVGSSFRRFLEAPTITNQGLRRAHFPMTEDLVLVIELNGTEPDWFFRWMEHWPRLLNLPENWDSYGASRINPDVVLGAMNFLLPHVQGLMVPPDVIPHRSGGVQLEWHMRDFDLEVLVLSERQYRISYIKEGAESVEDLVTSDPQIAVEALKGIAVSS